jgi:hypothetical protein
MTAPHPLPEYAPDFAPLAAYLDDNAETPRDGWQYMGHEQGHGAATGTVVYRRREDRGGDRMYLRLPAYLGAHKYDAAGVRI